jgi:succinoglycan biosynthesis protein ExoA
MKNSDQIVVSIVVPCLDEERTITFLLQAILQQTFPRFNMEVIIADGYSTDRTREKVHDFSLKNPDLRIRLVDNPKRSIPAAINLAVKSAVGTYILRLDAHSIPRETYIEFCVDLLKNGKAECVGGVWDILPGSETWIARSIAAAAANPIAVGDARYRYTDSADYVDTVPFGAFSRELFLKIGGFNEDLQSNEDYEFFTRIRKNNGRIWLDPKIRCSYFARENLRELMRQYWRYGFWKFKMLKKFPETVRWRQALPPLFVLTCLVLILSSFFSKIFLCFLLGMLFFYLSILIGTGIIAAFRKKEPMLLFGMPLAIACMHFSWGTGFLYSIIMN